MLREYLLGLSLIEYTIIHSAPLQELCGQEKRLFYLSVER